MVDVIFPFMIMLSELSYIYFLQSILTFISIFASTASTTNLSLTTDVDIAKFFNDSRLVPDLVPVPPKQLLQVTYDSGPLIPGKRLRYLESYNKPNVTWKAEPDQLYLLFMSRLYHMVASDDTELTNTTNFPIESHHWIVVNIPGNNVTRGDTIDPYKRPVAAADYDCFERYTFLVYKQPERIQKSEFHQPEVHQRFAPLKVCTVHKFATSYQCGHPVAGNFFIAHW